MIKKTKSSTWGLIARLILRNRLLLIVAIVGMTLFWASQWKYMQFTFTEANLLPDNHPENILYKKFTNTFGEEGNVIVVALQDSLFFTPTVSLVNVTAAGHALSSKSAFIQLLSTTQ